MFMYVYSYCNALSARFFAVDRALNSYIMIMIMISSSTSQPINVPLKVLDLQTVPGLIPVTLMAQASHALGVNGFPQIGSSKYENAIS